jgi:hypothetical protein
LEIQGETVVMLQVIETSGLHLSRQPFSVQADLHGEREPGLNASIEEAEDRMGVNCGVSLIQTRGRKGAEKCDAPMPSR